MEFKKRKRLEATGKFNVETRGYEYLAPMFLMEFNLSNPYLKDIRVRRAIAHAVDRDLIVKTIWFGFGRPATGPVPSVLTQFYSSDLTKYAFCVFRTNVTDRFGIVTAEFGIVTDRFGDVTDGGSEPT